VKLLYLPIGNKWVYKSGIPKLESLTLIYQCGNLPVRQTPEREIRRSAHDFCGLSHAQAFPRSFVDHSTFLSIMFGRK